MEKPTPAPHPLAIDAKAVRALLVDFLRMEIAGAGFTKGVIGISGGVDSALAAVLSAEALGAGNVLGVLMPYRTSDPANIADARAVAGLCGILSESVDISPMVDAYLERSGETTNIRKGNLMARQRMIVLYDLSAREQALVIGTSNRTEILLGYGTQYGDTACAVNPLGDLYKTQVWELAREAGVPERIISKKPTADLWKGQTDEGELGFTYERADQLLNAMIDEQKSDVELEAMGFEKPFVDSVRNMVKRNRFKGRPPVIARIPFRAGDTGSPLPGGRDD